MRDVLKIGVEEIIFSYFKSFSDFSEQDLKLSMSEGSILLNDVIDYFMNCYDKSQNITLKMIETCLSNFIICKNDGNEIRHYTRDYFNYKIIAQSNNYVVIEKH